MITPYMLFKKKKKTEAQNQESKPDRINPLETSHCKSRVKAAKLKRSQSTSCNSTRCNCRGHACHLLPNNHLCFVHYCRWFPLKTCSKSTNIYRLPYVHSLQYFSLLCQENQSLFLLIFIKS